MCAKTTILLCLAAIAACCGGATITIGDKEYTMTDLIKDGAKSHIIVNKGHVLINRFLLSRVTLSDTDESNEVYGLDDGWVQDLAMDGTGAVWLATRNGLYKMESLNTNATYVVGKDNDLFCVAVDSTNTVYASAHFPEDVYVYQDNALQKVPGIKASSIAFSNNGNVYYVSRASNRFVSKKQGIQATEVTKITMPGLHLAATVELDKKTDTLYILSSSNHLFYVPPGSTAAIQVDGIKDMEAIGIDHEGNIYLGTSVNVYNLTPVPAENENVL